MRTLVIIASLLLIMLGATGAEAHAHLDHSSPAVGSTVPSAPQEITLWFTQNLEAVFSTVEVLDGNGGRVDDGKPSISGNTMRVALKPLPPGTYRVHWHALSVDTHTTDGTFTFQVGGTRPN
jgi:copper resistance protein C